MFDNFVSRSHRTERPGDQTPRSQHSRAYLGQKSGEDLDDEHSRSMSRGTRSISRDPSVGKGIKKLAFIMGATDNLNLAE